MEPVVYVLAGIVIALIVVILWLWNDHVALIDRYRISTHESEREYMDRVERQQAHFAAQYDAQNERHDEQIRHLLNRIQAPEYAVTEVAGSSTKPGIGYVEDEVEKDPNEPEFAENDQDFEQSGGRNIPLSELKVPPLEPQQPHQPLSIEGDNNGISGS